MSDILDRLPILSLVDTGLWEPDEDYYSKRKSYSHGTVWGYRRGCRCEKCRASYSVKRRRQKENRKLRVIDPNAPFHGTESGYNHHGCRCDDCRKAHREYARKKRAGWGQRDPIQEIREEVKGIYVPRRGRPPKPPTLGVNPFSDE